MRTLITLVVLPLALTTASAGNWPPPTNSDPLSCVDCQDVAANALTRTVLKGYQRWSFRDHLVSMGRSGPVISTQWSSFVVTDPTTGCPTDRRSPWFILRLSAPQNGSQLPVFNLFDIALQHRSEAVLIDFVDQNGAPLPVNMGANSIQLTGYRSARNVDGSLVNVSGISPPDVTFSPVQVSGGDLKNFYLIEPAGPWQQNLTKHDVGYEVKAPYAELYIHVCYVLTPPGALLTRNVKGSRANMPFELQDGGSPPDDSSQIQ